jgi:hypothetical protein
MSQKENLRSVLFLGFYIYLCPSPVLSLTGQLAHQESQDDLFIVTVGNAIMPHFVALFGL